MIITSGVWIQLNGAQMHTRHGILSKTGTNAQEPSVCREYLIILGSIPNGAGTDGVVVLLSFLAAPLALDPV